jgi:hypothetical protein
VRRRRALRGAQELAAWPVTGLALVRLKAYRGSGDGHHPRQGPRVCRRPPRGARRTRGRTRPSLSVAVNAPLGGNRAAAAACPPAGPRLGRRRRLQSREAGGPGAAGRPKGWFSIPPVDGPVSGDLGIQLQPPRRSGEALPFRTRRQDVRDAGPGPRRRRLDHRLRRRCAARGTRSGCRPGRAANPWGCLPAVSLGDGARPRGPHPVLLPGPRHGPAPGMMNARRRRIPGEGQERNAPLPAAEGISRGVTTAAEQQQADPDHLPRRHTGRPASTSGRAGGGGIGVRVTLGCPGPDGESGR